MAILQNTKLEFCTSIPSFIESGSTTVFENATAPTSWTKSITHNNKTLRVVSGSIVNGGSTAFTSIFTTRTVDGTVSSVVSGFEVGPAPSQITIDSATAVITFGSASAVAGPHTHPYLMNEQNNRTAGPVATHMFGPSPNNSVMGATGGGIQHSHPGYTGGAHTHPLTVAAHAHTSPESPHNHVESMSPQDFRVYYRDVILATKD